MTSRALNFLWMNLDLPAPPDPRDGSILAPMPPNYIGNVRQAGERHPKADIMLWVDSKRLTKKQMAYLKQEVEHGLKNVHLCDLRDIPAYNNEALYNSTEEKAQWRDMGQVSLIWRQVDCAKILLCLQKTHDQTFFADLDRSHVDITSREVQGMIKKHGLMIGNYKPSKADLSVENQLWGFDKRRLEFFEDYYESARSWAYKERNAFSLLRDMVKSELQDGEGIKLAEICLPIESDGTRASHPGHVYSKGHGEQAKPVKIPEHKLTEKFKKTERPKKNPRRTPPPPKMEKSPW